MSDIGDTNEQKHRKKRYKSFKAFYPFYLTQHQNSTCRGLHYVGSLIVLIILIAAIITGSLVSLFLLPIVGYGFAWLGHYLFEKNRPATFEYPLYSFMADWVMFGQKVIRLFSKIKDN